MQSRHYSQLYRQLRDLNPRDHQRIIRTYEEQEAEIGQLDALEYFELTVYYVDALFETGAYRQHLMMVDHPIQACIAENIERVEGITGDIFEHLLFRKAVSAFRLQDYPKAIHVTKELIRINPERELFVRFLRATIFKEQTGVLQFGRASFIFCMLLTAFVITLDLLFVRTFYPSQSDLMQGVTIDVFVIGLLLLVGSFGFAFYRAHREAFTFQREAAKK
ncbi:MAG: hypothetical protein AAGA62_06660 [Bacteroidota bacterium]